MPVRSCLLWLSLTLCACAGGERVHLDAKSPAPPKGATLRPVAISVSDDREEVKNGDKHEWYLGEAPSDGGKELSNHQLLPLHTQLRDDLTDELKSLGFDVVAESKVRKLTVSIREWRYDPDARVLRYRIEAEVLERDDGAMLGQSMLAENLAIGEDSEKKTKAALKAAYVAIVRSILRDNPTVLAALQR